MIANALMKDLGFADMGRLLQRTTSDNSTISSESQKFNVAMAFLFVVLMLAMAIFACRKRTELPRDKTMHMTLKSTLAGRKRAILELFKNSEVTMVSHGLIGVSKSFRISNSREI
jgi:hypothetical protein